MDLAELITWANNYDVAKVEQTRNKRGHASTYLGMIIDKGNAIMRNTRQTEGYMKDIKEYLAQLDKIGVSPKNPVGISETVRETQKPLIP